VDWVPSDLPEVVGAICKDKGIHFIDVTPELIAETARGHLTYQTWDSHLNRQGSAGVANAIINAWRNEQQKNQVMN
jgi:hypothetical protein